MAKAPVAPSAAAAAPVAPAPPQAQGRESFVSLVADALDRARVDYVVLHGYGGKDRFEHDLDLLVSRASLETVDALIRLGTFGRLTQRVYYDVPHCVSYVVEADGPWRFRQIDVACDPWGICKYGDALREALPGAVREESGRRVPAPPASVLYLAVKRGWKGQSSAADTAPLRRAFERDPEGAAANLRRFGAPGRSLALALESGREDLGAELRALARTVRRKRLRPDLLLLRLLFQLRRVAIRVIRPTGYVVWIAGPDGTGKSTLAGKLQQGTTGLFRRSCRLHAAPAWLPPPSKLARRPAADVTRPHGRRPSGPLGSLLRLGYLLTDAVLVGALRIPRARIRSTLVIVERGWLDLALDPLRYRLSLSPRLLRAAVRLAPRPDLVLVLDVDPETAFARKPELSREEIERQRHAWRALAAADPARFVVVDASEGAEEVFETARRAVADRMAARAREWSSSRFLVTCLGQPATDGIPKVALHLRGRLRWLLPARLGAPGPRGAGLYRPALSWHVAGAAGLEAGQRIGLGRTRRTIHVDPSDGVLGTVEEMLGRDGLELAGAAPRTGLPASRALLAVLDRGRPVAYAKVDAADGSKLDREARVLNALAAAAPASFATPVVRGLGGWRDCTVLVVDALPIRGRADRDLGHLERRALAELQTLGPELSTVLGGGGAGAVPVHGDFAPWNCGTVDDRLAIWDWEDARLGLPLEDELTWQLQRLVLFGRGSVDAVVASALEAGDTTGPEALRAVLDHDLRRAPDPRATAIRRQVLSRLEERSR